VSKKLPNCEDDDRKFRTLPFCYLGYGQVYTLLNRHEDAYNAYIRAVQYYKDCVKRKVDFFIPDCMLCFVGAVKSLIELNDKDKVASIIDETDDFIRDMQNINKHIPHNHMFMYLKDKTLAYKAIGDMDNMQKTKDYAIELFDTTLSDEDKNNDILRNILQEIRDI
jgi:tetratricopeptide (TPR) repeat protein